METTYISEPDVLAFIEKEYFQCRNSNCVLSIFAVNTRDIIKFLKHPEKCGNWPFDFVLKVLESIEKIKEKYIIPYPTIEKQKEEDRVLSRLLAKNRNFCLGTNTFFKGNVKAEHVILYMERNDEIKNWGAYFLHCVQLETLRVKEFLL